MSLCTSSSLSSVQQVPERNHEYELNEQCWLYSLEASYYYILLYVAIYTNITVYAVAAGRRSIYKAQEHLRKDTNASSNIEL